MADMVGQVVIGQKARGGSGSHVQWAMTSDGAGVVVPWLFALSLEGLVFTTGFGAANLDDTDPGTFGPGAIAFDEHDLLITLPATAGLQVIPVYWKPVFEAIGTIAAVDVLLAVGAAGGIANGLTTPTPGNQHNGAPNT